MGVGAGKDCGAAASGVPGLPVVPRAERQDRQAQGHLRAFRLLRHQQVTKQAHFPDLVTLSGTAYNTG